MKILLWCWEKLRAWISYVLEHAFPIVSWLLAALFAWGFLEEAGVPPTEVKEHWPNLVAFLIFFLLPFARKVDFFQIFSFEAKIEEVKKEVKDTNGKVDDVKQDIRHVLNQQMALTASVHSSNNQKIDIHNYDRPPPDQKAAAREEVANLTPDNSAEDAQTSVSGLSDEELVKIIFSDDGHEAQPGSDKLGMIASHFEDIRDIQKLNLSERAVILRVRIEAHLKRLGAAFIDPKKFRPSPFRGLLEGVVNYYPEVAPYQDSLQVFYRIASQAAHAAEVPVEDLDLAIYLGERLLRVLSQIEARPH